MYILSITKGIFMCVSALNIFISPLYLLVYKQKIDRRSRANGSFFPIYDEMTKSYLPGGQTELAALFSGFGS